ncbi:MAG: exodeoxyribonuclease V subunit alpha [Proteobacteria bacterium]|nr:exodeoxyribonuclease V subunit alpha [Pseudomonadota bacterium]
MKPPRNWFQPSPHGTARERFARMGRFVMGVTPDSAQDGANASSAAAGAALDSDDMRDFFRNVAAGVHAHDLGDESLYLAEELAELQWSLGGRQKRALALLVLASMISVREGSTRLPLSRGESSYLGQLISSLVRVGKLDLDTRTLLRDIDKLTRAVTLDHIIGRRGEYRPLIVDDGCVYQHRMLQCEDQLAERLRERLHPRLPGRPEQCDAALFGSIELPDREELPDRGLSELAGSGSAPGSTEADLEAALAEVVARPAAISGRPIVLSAEQQHAVRRAIGQRFTVISGGPGTGKTAIVVTMLRIFRRLGRAADDIALAAPTGKAANRMWSSIRRGLQAVAERDSADQDLLDDLLDSRVEPQTLHRLLGYLPSRDRFRHHENNPLPVSTVIVDEASMIDLVLMERLLRALRGDTRLILLGDAEQLPSVDAGAVLRDLVTASQRSADAGAGRVAGYSVEREPAQFAVRLTHSYRMDPSDPAGRAILMAAREVNAGNARALFQTGGKSSARIEVRNAPSELDYRGIELLDNSAELSAVHGFVDAWYKKRICGQNDFARLASKTYEYRGGAWSAGDRRDLGHLMAIYDRSRLLTVTRRHNTGAEAINRRLHRRVLTEASTDSSPEFYPGEPVMMRRNDYERGLFNGDQGVVVRVSEDRGVQRYRVVFPRAGSYDLFHLDALRSQIELAFAMTVHKSQGSEFDEVALILPTAEIPLLTREMLYTGITRARRSVILVGTEELARTAIDRAGQRFCGLADKLAVSSGGLDGAALGSKAS